jgi:shikimate kinase
MTYSRIALVGMMGVGKTTIGCRLAQLLHWSFVDTDVLVEKQTGRTINDIFSSDGESAFRELERAALLTALKQERAVLALGGGAVVYRDSITLLKQQALVIWLMADMHDLVARTRADDSRPLLRGVDQRAVLEELLCARKSYYEQAHLHIDTTGLSVVEVCSLIIQHLGEVSRGEGS